MKTNTKIYFLAYKKSLTGLIVIVVLGLLVFSVRALTAPPSPVPANIKRQADFKVIYAKGYDYTNANWKYQSSNNLLSFNIEKNGSSVVLTEQKTPLAYQDDIAAYNRFIGSLRPSATFNAPLGSVSITNFVTAGDFQAVGSTGILNAKGTLLLAHADNKLNEEQWRGLFNSLKFDN